MSRIYDNQPLKNLPVNNVDYPKKWSQDSFISGDGVILEGTIQSRSHIAVSDPSKNKAFYYIFHVKIIRAHKRKFDSQGQEIEPNFSETKKVNTGYLNTYKVEAKGISDRLSEDQVTTLINKQELTAYTAGDAPHNAVSLWIQEQKCEGLEFEAGDSVRVKTNGDSPFIFSIAQMDTQSRTVSNYAGGGAVGGSWTDKIMDVKSSAPSQTEDGNGADDDEWDD